MVRRGGIFAFALAVGLHCLAASGSAEAARCAPLPPASSNGFLPKLTQFLNNKCYQREGWEHDAAVRTSDGVHPYVKIWYSPAIFTWMTVNQRKGPVPNGAVIVKEMYVSPTAPLTEWTVMIKDSNIAWDGWYWGDLVNPSPRDPNAAPKPPPGGCAEPQVLFNGAGLYCLNCHASAILSQGTYVSTAYLAAAAPSAIASSMDATNEMGPFTIEDTSALEAQLAPEFIAQIPSSVFTNLRPFTSLRPPCMVSEALDHVVTPSAAHGGPQQFVTSDQAADVTMQREP
jgi:hypothetical protein